MVKNGGPKSKNKWSKNLLKQDHVESTFFVLVIKDMVERFYFVNEILTNNYFEKKKLDHYKSILSVIAKDKKVQ